MKICKYVRLVTCTLHAHICHICAMLSQSEMGAGRWELGVVAGAGAGVEVARGAASGASCYMGST